MYCVDPDRRDGLRELRLLILGFAEGLRAAHAQSSSLSFPQQFKQFLKTRYGPSSFDAFQMVLDNEGEDAFTRFFELVDEFETYLRDAEPEAPGGGSLRGPR